MVAIGGSSWRDLASTEEHYVSSSPDAEDITRDAVPIINNGKHQHLILRGGGVMEKAITSNGKDFLS